LPQNTKNSLGIGKIDRIALFLYIAMVIAGWLNIYAAVYNEEHSNIFDMSQKYGKQLIWIGTATILAFIILMVEADFFSLFAWIIYGSLIVLLIATLFIGVDVKGSKSWIKFGDFQLQPAEFAKFATCLAIAKFISSRDTNLNAWRDRFYVGAIILAPITIIIGQHEAGVALVFFALIFALYREGLPGTFLLIGFGTIVLFVLSLIFDPLFIIIGIAIVGLIYYLMNRRIRFVWFYIIITVVISSGIAYGTNFAFSKLESHQKDRINNLLGKSTDLKGIGYNVNQAKIAIGSGGLIGKGYLQGTQTKFDFVPEQDTDFIFCTVGEEWGFLGSLLVLCAELGLIIRIIILAEIQRSEFSRVYGYCIASIFFFHLMVNIGMTIGLMPVIGIPLPFFSYGGSSLWSFTIMLFIFLKFDSRRSIMFR
jgi:rod shape determining protein RodA